MSVLNGIINLFRFNRTNWKAVALCFAAATIFWFFNALNKEHTATISYPIEFQYDQVRYIPVKDLPNNVALNITGSGWDLLRKSLGFKVTPLQIALEKPSETNKISPSTILPVAALQLNQTKINHIVNDTLFINIDLRKTKKLRLAVNQNQFRFELGYGLASTITITPDSVFVEGPGRIIEKLSDTLLLPFPTGRISQNVKTEIDINNDGINAITISPSTATVQFEVGELQDIKRTVKVIVLPAPPFRYQVSADSLNITLRLPSKLKNNLTNALGLVAVVDLRGMDAGVSKVAPSVKGIPDFAELLSVDSVTIRKY